MLHSKLFSVTPILTRVWKLGGPSKFSSGTIRIAWGNHVYPSEGFYQNRAPNLWTTGQKPLKCLHQKVSKRTSEACQNRKRPDTHSKLTSARAIYRKNSQKVAGAHISIFCRYFFQWVRFQNCILSFGPSLYISSCVYYTYIWTLYIWWECHGECLIWAY